MTVTTEQLHVVAKPVTFGTNTIWTYRTTAQAWYVYDQKSIAFFVEDDAKKIASKYQGAIVVPAEQAGKLNELLDAK